MNVLFPFKIISTDKNVVQWYKCLPSLSKALGLTPNTTKIEYTVL